MRRTAALLALLAAVVASPAAAQGTDQTPAQRDLMVIARWLPGHFTNAEQAYFDKRGGGVARMVEDWTVSGGPIDFAVARTGAPALRWSLVADAGPDRVRMRQSTGCDLFWRREAGQFHAEAEASCTAPGLRTAALSATKLWAGPGPLADAARMNRARDFACYVDIPGVGGGKAIPFHRYDGLKLHDGGGEARFVTSETPPRTLGVRLRNVDWAINNAPNVFTRNSLTLYVFEAKPDGTTPEIAYAWGEPRAERIGLNLKSLLANCFMQAPKDAVAEF